MRCRLPAVTALLLAALAVPAADPPGPIPPKTVKLNDPYVTLDKAVAAITRQTGIPVGVPDARKAETVDAIFNGVPFWTALEAVADRTGTRIALADLGRRVVLEPRGTCKEVSAVSGPFRVVARGVVARADLSHGQTTYEVQLEAHWEPRFPVFRADAHPRLTKATDDRGTALTATPSSTRTAVRGAAHLLPVRLTGLARASRKVAVLAGDFGVTAAPEMLPFRFPDPAGKLPAAGELPKAVADRLKGRVTAALRRFERDPTTRTWEAEFELTYPADQPKWETFEAEAWLSENRARLLSPDGKALLPDGYEIPEAGRRVVAVYRFKEDAAKGLTNPAGKGWALSYDTPAPLVEFRVPFELRDVPLP